MRGEKHQYGPLIYWTISSSETDAPALTLCCSPAVSNGVDMNRGRNRNTNWLIRLACVSSSLCTADQVCPALWSVSKITSLALSGVNQTSQTLTMAVRASPLTWSDQFCRAWKSEPWMCFSFRKTSGHMKCLLSFVLFDFTSNLQITSWH